VSGLAFADPTLGRALQSELFRAALECGEPVRVCLALAQEVCYAAGAGSRNSVVVDAVGARLEAIAKRIGHPYTLGLADTALGIAAYMNGRWTEARTRLEAGLATLRDHGAGVRWEIDIAESYWLGTLFYLGEWRELVRQSNVMLKEAVERGDIVAQLGIRTGHGSLAWLINGRLDDAKAQLEAAVQVLPPGFALPNVHAIIAACNVGIYAGDAANAATYLREAWPEIERLGVLRMQYMRVELELLRARVTLADPSRSRDERAKIALEISEELVKEGAPWAVGLGLLVRASALAARQQFALAIQTLRAAEEQLVATGMTGWLYVARLRRGSIEGSLGGHARAAAAHDMLGDFGVAQPERFADVLVPWPA
jgi:hypothetical protein